MNDPTLHTTDVDLAGLFTVLSEHLYSTPHVALRELLQNASDACVRRRLEQPSAPPPEIRVSTSTASATLLIEDNGAGLTHDEVIEYLATVGRGYTRKLRDGSGSRELIGLFGLGFLSAFVIAERITVRTTSADTPHVGHIYRSRDAQRYSIEVSPPFFVGMSVELALKDRFAMLTNPERVAEILMRYGCLLPIPILLDGRRINDLAPPWRSPRDEHPTRFRRSCMEFAGRFEPRFAPITTIEIRSDARCDVRGLLWIQDGASYGSNDNRQLSVFVRGMLLDDGARELLPHWAGFVSGVVESDALTPTASREDLQRDNNYRGAQAHIEQQLVEGLLQVANREPEAFRRILLRHNEALIGAALASDALFDLLADHLLIPTTEGDLPFAEVRARAKGRIRLSRSEHGGFEEVLFRALKVPVLLGNRFGVLPFARKLTRQRGCDLIELGSESANREVFRPAAIDADAQSLLVRCFGNKHTIMAAHFEPSDVPLVVVVDRDAELKTRLESDEANRRISEAALSLARAYTRTVEATRVTTLYVNVDSEAIRALLAHGSAATEDHPGVSLLRAMVAFVEGTGQSHAAADLSQALRDFSKVVIGLFGANPSTSGQANTTTR